jgi:hypothetical protein
MLIDTIVGIALVYIAVIVYLNLKAEMQELWDWEK